MIYGVRTNGNLHGSVYTKTEVVEAILDIADYFPTRNLSRLSVLDPAGGEGVFVLACLDRLYQSSLNFNFSFVDAINENLRVYEISSDLCAIISKRIGDFLSEKGLFSNRIKLKEIVRCEDYLLTSGERFDLIIGNPPYVRHEKIPSEKKSKYKTLFQTFSHRSDLYVCFFEKALKSLSKDGKLCFICSNRWIKNQYGQKLRSLISESFSFPLLLNLERFNAFEEDVIAYPAIGLIENGPKASWTRYLEIENHDELVEALRPNSKNSTYIKILSEGIKLKAQGKRSKVKLDLIETQGFKIGIGVATGADSVFIGTDLPNYIEEDLLLPILTSKDLVGGRIVWLGNYLINPFLKDSKDLVNLDDFPLLKKYLTKHKARLQGRHVSKKQPQKWFKTIDRIYPELVQHPKLLLPDFATRQVIHLDEGGYYPHHNLYYITGRSKQDLKALGTILMSDFVKDQLSTIGNKMNGGYVRWQSQNLRKLQVPVFSTMDSQYKEELASAFEIKDLKAINKLVNAYVTV